MLFHVVCDIILDILSSPAYNRSQYAGVIRCDPYIVKAGPDFIRIGDALAVIHHDLFIPVGFYPFCFQVGVAALLQMLQMDIAGKAAPFQPG